MSRTGPKTDVWQFYVLPHTSAGHIMTDAFTGYLRIFIILSHAHWQLNEREEFKELR